MEINITEYLRYYIGHQMMISFTLASSPNRPINYVTKITEFSIYYHTDLNIKDATNYQTKPILRTWASLTSKEATEIARLVSKYGTFEAPQKETMFTPAQMHYILKIGIDIFGLIEAGYAIDAATIKEG